jgi:DUF1365 family protein
MTASALYTGSVVHQRFRPRRHRLQYRVFQLLLDVDELPALARRLRLLSHNRFNALSFYDRDHGHGGAASLRAYVEGELARAGLSIDGGRILLLSMPRVFGYVLNPLSVYYCHDRAGELRAMIYEVNNTFGQRHSYLIPVDGPARLPIRQACAKTFHVSPFMGMEMTYEFRLTEPGAAIATTVRGRDDEGNLLIFAAFTGTRRPLSDRTLLGVLLAFPFLTLAVIAAIHWEALKLLIKGLRLKPSPPDPEGPVTIVRRTDSGAGRAT